MQMKGIQILLDEYILLYDIKKVEECDYERHKSTLGNNLFSLTL